MNTMQAQNTQEYLKKVVANMPQDWLNLTTHRLDIYHEELAKEEFLDLFESLFQKQISSTEELSELPTAYDYIRLGHPLSSILEWALAKMNKLNPKGVIAFSSQTAPILAILRKNLFSQKNTRILYVDQLPNGFDSELIKTVYGYSFELHKVDAIEDVSSFEGSTVLITQHEQIAPMQKHEHIQFHVHLYNELGSVLLLDGQESYISEVQHVRRRETISMTPSNCLIALNSYIQDSPFTKGRNNMDLHRKEVVNCISQITETETDAIVGSSGLSIQYAIMMGLVHDAMQKHPDKKIRFIVPPNCYGGTNDQARRVAACINHVEIVDLPVDAGNDMVQGVNEILDQMAAQDAVPYIIAEIPTNPRVEVPELEQLQLTLQKKRTNPQGQNAVDPVFILDQTFCPNVHFLGEGRYLSKIRAISYASGSKFPSGGKCTAGYCVANNMAKELMPIIQQHLHICDNEATNLQYAFLAEQLPSMNDRIEGAYQNTRKFVNFIQKVLPSAKINFVSEELAAKGFTPSVFSLDLPTKGHTEEEKESYKRKMNHLLINMMITAIPEESKYCVSYGQLKGCYWTIPATSTQGTTKEGDKDYIARVSLSANMDLDKHKEVFAQFVQKM
jgi:cystathionine beta-lyase/cystathionine gamma-synthase